MDSNAIEYKIESKHDYTKVNTLFLNEDLEKTLDIISDMIKNSTFAEFDKEVRKFKGEIKMALDSPRSKAVDNFLKNLYPGHIYGCSHTTILEELDTITKKEVKEFHKKLITPENMVITFVGDIDKKQVLTLLDKYFGDISKKEAEELNLEVPTIKQSKTVTIEKNDASQAQVMQGWVVPGVGSDDYPALVLLNTILGSSGLSSRLFVELRDKQGLAYVVRSAYDPYKLCGTFSVYIATEPKNIKVSLDGFKSEIKKLQDELVSEKELNDAKSNVLGKRAFFHETNAQQANYLGHYEILGLGCDFDTKIPQKIKNVTSQQVQDVAKKYLSNDSIISLLAPDEFLKGF